MLMLWLYCFVIVLLITVPVSRRHYCTIQGVLRDGATVDCGVYCWSCTTGTLTLGQKGGRVTVAGRHVLSLYSWPPGDSQDGQETRRGITRWPRLLSHLVITTLLSPGHYNSTLTWSLWLSSGISPGHYHTNHYGDFGHVRELWGLKWADHVLKCEQISVAP